MHRLQLIAAGIGIGQDLEGVECGPEAWFDFFQKYYPSLMVTEPDIEHIKICLPAFHLNNNKESKNFPFSVYDSIARKVVESRRRGQIPVTFGGDHSVAMGSITGSLVLNQATKVLWVDAHGDINTPETTLTGRVHGMPLAYLLGLWAQDRIRTRLHEKNVVLLGVRDLDSGERKIIQDLKIKVISRSEISARGMKSCLQEALSFLQADKSELHVSFDVDAMDPQLFPQTGVPVKRGLNVHDVQLLFQELSRLETLRAVDIVEFNPLVGEKGLSDKDGRHLIAEFLSKLTHIPRISPQNSYHSSLSAFENMAWPNLA